MNHEKHGQHEESEKILYRDESYAIQGAIFEGYREMGSGYLESVYQECLEIELAQRKIPYVAQSRLYLNYKGERLRHTYQPDLICYSKIIVELKAVKDYSAVHKAQLINYLKATGKKLGLVLNFGGERVQVKRVANSV